MAGGQPVVQSDPPWWYGLPEYGVDAAANANDTYATVVTATKKCTHASVYVESEDAIISFDGGTTDHFFLDVGAGQVLLSGLKIPVGAVIEGKNAVIGADYTNLRIAIW